jgi:hypothetical protein
VRFVTIAVASLSATWIAAPLAGATTAERVSYQAGVRVSGQVIVSFHSDRAAGCEAAFRCDVRSGTIRWTPRTRGQLSLLGQPGRRLTGYLSLFGEAETTVDTLAVVERSASDGSHVCADARVSSYFAAPLASVGRRGLRFGLRSRPGVFGPLTATNLVTSCGGPLPADALRGLPTRAVSLRALRAAPSRIDLSGSVPFSSGGFAGTVESTVLVRLQKARVRRPRLRPRRVTPRRSSRPPIRQIAVEYRLARMTGSVPVEVAGNPRACLPLDACGLAGTLTVTPGPARAEAYVVAYGRLPRAVLRRAVGLAPGPPPRKVGVYGYLAWDRARGTMTADLQRDGIPACRDSTRIRNGFIALGVRGRRVTARLGYGAEELGGAGALVTRCPGPMFSDLGRSTRLAIGRIPRSALGRRRVELHLDQGATALTPGYTLRSRPNLTVVLEREKVEERELSGEAFIEVGDDGGGGGGGDSVILARRAG